MKQKSIKPKLFFLLGLSVSLLNGCAVIKAGPAEHAGFLPKPELVEEHRERAPFQGYWVFDPVEYEEVKKEYAKIYIAPVDTEVVRQIYLASSGSEKTKTERIQEAEELANYWRASLLLYLEEKGQNNPLGKEIELVDEPGPETLTVRLALTQVVPTNPGVNLVGTAAGFFVPGGGLIKLAGEGSVAMEGFVHELNPDEDVLEQYKDREGQKASLFTLKDYQRYAHIRAAIDEWSQQISDLLTTPHDVTVEDPIPVSLNPL